MSDDPFAFHPELRALIRDPDASLFRDFDVRKFLAELPPAELELQVFDDATREAGRLALLADRRGADLWVFAYGSLMWDPAFRFAEVRRAFAPGHQRRFILKDTFGGRGSAEQPGVMAALDEGAGCHGLAFRIAQDEIEEETRRLWSRERAGPAYVEAMIPVELSDRRVEAVTFLADHGADAIFPELSREEQITFAATGTGLFGTSYEYIENLAAGFAAVGVEDAEVTDLLNAIRERRAAP